MTGFFILAALSALFFLLVCGDVTPVQVFNVTMRSDTRAMTLCEHGLCRLILQQAFFVGLPMVLLAPTKFALSFTVGSLCFMLAFAVSRGTHTNITLRAHCVASVN